MEPVTSQKKRTRRQACSQQQSTELLDAPAECTFQDHSRRGGESSGLDQQQVRKQGLRRNRKRKQNQATELSLQEQDASVSQTQGKGSMEKSTPKQEQSSQQQDKQPCKLEDSRDALAPVTPPRPNAPNLQRCHGSTQGDSERAERCQRYHDEEWGVPCVCDKTIMEFIILDTAQCGLSWRTIFERRAAYAKAFKYWDIEAISNMGAEDIDALLKEDSGIIRNRNKIEAAVHNACVARRVQQQWGSLAGFIWGLVPEGRPICNYFRTWSEVPAVTDQARAISRALQKEGFKYMGPTVTYAFMQTIGIVNDHPVTCFRHKELQDMHAKFTPPAVNSQCELLN